MKRLLWSVPAIAVYFYTATILTENGFISYFNIPSAFVETSLRNNVIFFSQLFSAYGYLLGHAGWYIKLVLGFAIGAIVAICYFSKVWKGIFTTIATFIVVISLGVFSSLGNVIATNQTNFVVPTSNCFLVDKNARYIVPVINGDYAVFVPIDGNNKMMGEFIAKKISDINCGFKRKEIGQITK